MIIKYLIIIFIFFTYYQLHSNDFEQYLFELNLDEPDNNLIEIFEYYRDFPINLSNTNPYSLSRLPDISFTLSQNILDDYQNNITWKEITLKNNLSNFQIYILENCTNIIKKDKELTVDYRSRIKHNVENKNAIIDNKFHGNKVDLYNRLSVDYDKLKFNIITNKDEGEISYLDDYSANINYTLDNHNFTLGDFRFHSGLGLLMNTGFPIRKSSNPDDALLNFGEGISPSRNLQALGHLRGIAYKSEYLINKLRVKTNLFYSNINRSATLVDDNNISSFYLNNLFRTDTEIKKKNTINEQLLASNIELNYSKFTLGFNYLNYNYNKNINSSSQNYYQGKHGNNLSIYTSYINNNHIIISEIAADNKNNLSLFSVYSYKYTNQEYGISFRYLNPNSRLQFNNILSNYSTNSNETGLMTYFTFYEGKIKNTIYLDFYSRPKIDYFQGIAQSGIEMFDEFNYKINNSQSLLTRLRYKSQKEINKSDTPNYYDNNRLDLRQEYKIQKDYSLRFRADINFTSHSESSYAGIGYLFFSEYSQSLFKSNTNSIRLTYYNTDSFEEAIWHYEYLLRGYLLAPPLYGEGYKILIKSNITIFENYLISFAYTFDYRPSVSSLGSGLDKIEGNLRNTLYLQLDYNFR